MIPYSARREERRAHRHHSDVLSGQIISDMQKRENFLKKQEKLKENEEKLKAYIAELRVIYSGDVLAYLEERVIAKWVQHKYKRDASLAHHDVENALKELGIV